MSITDKMVSTHRRQPGRTLGGIVSWGGEVTLFTLEPKFPPRKRGKQAGYGSTSTGVPMLTIFSTFSAFQFARRKQPWDCVREIASGSGVPWMP